MAVRVALVGLGAMGSGHLAGWRQIAGAELVAVCDDDAGRLADRASVAGNLDAGAVATARVADLRRTTDFAELLRQDDLDAVDLCTPTYLHASMAIQALKAGRHVFCEKPLALTAGDAARAVRAARRAGKALMVGHVLRFWPEYLMMKEMLDSGRFGPLRSGGFWRRGGMPAWGKGDWFARSDLSGSAAMDLHVHDTDAILWFFGRPGAVRSRGTRAADGGVDYLWTQYHYDGGAVICAEGGWVPGKAPFVMGARLVFERACVDYDFTRRPSLAVYLKDGSTEHPPAPEVKAHWVELEYFARCLEAGRPIERATGEQAAEAVAVVQAEVRSVVTGKAVAIRPPRGG